MSAALVKQLWGSKPNLYEIIGVAATASEAQIKKAYFKKALLWHPDKAGDDPEATKKFQALSFIHSILSDKARRKEYDRSGSIDDADEATDSESFEAWTGYWRTMFPVVTEEQIEQVLTEYRGSADEKADVLKWYDECEGDMEDMLECIIGAREEDVPRYVALVHAALKEGSVEEHEAFTATYGTADKPASKRGKAAAQRSSAARTARASAEAAEAEAMLAEIRAGHKAANRGKGKGGDKEPSLEDLILARQASRGSFLASLEARYASAGAGAGAGAGKSGTGKGKGRKGRADDDDDEEEDEDEEEQHLPAAGGSAKGRGKKGAGAAAGPGAGAAASKPSPAKKRK